MASTTSEAWAASATISRAPRLFKGVAHQDVVGAQVQFPIVDDGVSPGLALLEGGSEHAFHSKGIGVGFDDRDQRVTFVAKNQMAISVEHGCRTTGLLGTCPVLFFPLDFARHEIQADWHSLVLPVASVEMVTDQDDAAMVVLEFLGAQEIDFFDIELWTVL